MFDYNPQVEIHGRILWTLQIAAGINSLKRDRDTLNDAFSTQRKAERTCHPLTVPIDGSVNQSVIVLPKQLCNNSGRFLSQLTRVCLWV